MKLHTVTAKTRKKNSYDLVTVKQQGAIMFGKSCVKCLVSLAF